MSPLQWDPTLETGDELVDRQHRDVFELVNELDDLETDDVAKILDIVDRLMAHVDIHFATEEDLMVRGGYPSDAYEEHVREHRRLKDRARSVALDFRGGWDLTKGPFVEFLRAWLLDHIETEDRKLIAHLKARGQVAELPRV